MKQFYVNLWQLYRGLPSSPDRLETSDGLHVVGGIQSHPPVLPTLAPALLVLLLQLLELITSFESKFVRFSCFVVVEGPDGLTRLAVVRQNVLTVVPLLGLVVEWIGFLRAVTEKGRSYTWFVILYGKSQVTK